MGLTLSPETIKNHLVFECGDSSTLLIYGRGAGNKADHTQVRFWSTDIYKDVAELAANGIEFDEYDTETFKTIDHVVTSPGIGRSGVVQGPRREHHRRLSTGIGTGSSRFGTSMYGLGS